MNTIAQRFAARDLAACLRASEAHKAENLERQRRAQANPELGAALLESARRRGRNKIDWPAYFREAFMV